jgi:hypothetical protein
MLCFGSDFDNTIIDYTHLFRPAALEFGIDVPASCLSKAALRDYIRTCPDGELIWQKIQARVYGPGIEKATLLYGFERFALACRRNRIPLYIVSHKTRFAAQDRTVDLRMAAMGWMERKGFFLDDGLGLSPSQVFFEETRKEKIERIRGLGCTHFVDDMIEVLGDPHFPDKVTRLLLGGDTAKERSGGTVRCASWDEVYRCVFS